MAITSLWMQFGDTIAKSPHLTLAAFLGHSASIAVTKQEFLWYPKTADFQVDPAYDPNYHKLELDEDYLNSNFFLRCISTWGAEPLIHAVNACSLLQCMHQTSSPPHLAALRSDAAFILQRMIDAPTSKLKNEAKQVLHLCNAEYRSHEDAPDTAEAIMIRNHLGAPWFGLETLLSNLDARNECGEREPGPSHSTWIARNSVWPDCALHAAAHWSSYGLAREAISSTLIAWATRDR